MANGQSGRIVIDCLVAMDLMLFSDERLFRMRRRAKVILLVVCLLLLAVLAALGFSLARFSMTGKRQTLEEARRWQEEHYDFSFYDPLEKEAYTVMTQDGYVLHAQLLKNPAPSDKYILVSHGYTDNRFGAMKYAPMYLAQGFNVIVYDLRGHGANVSSVCTYSVLERKDLLAMIQDSRERFRNMAILGIHGESLGAATSVAVLKEKPPVDFVVADCGFSDIVPVLKGAMKGMHLPGFLVYLVSVCARIRYGYSFREMRPIESLRENHIPILFIHGAEDSFILPEHSERMKAATKGYAELHLIPGAGHALSILTDPKKYQAIVRGFLTEQFPGV